MSPIVFKQFLLVQIILNLNFFNIFLGHSHVVRGIHDDLGEDLLLKQLGDDLVSTFNLRILSITVLATFADGV